jgi:hypothetical protein
MTDLLEPTATAELDGDLFTLRLGSLCSLDSGRVPYAGGDLTLPLVDDALLELLDPDTGIRIPVSATLSGVTRNFDLVLRGRTVNHTAKTVTLTLASDEALMQDYATLTLDTGARAHETSVRAVCDYVLDKIGAGLEPGIEDVDVTAHWEVTNILANPSLAVDMAGWIAGLGATSLTREVLAPLPPLSTGTGIRWVASGSVSNVVPAPTTSTYSIKPGNWYVFSGWIYSSTPRTARAAIQWFAAGGGVLVSEPQGDPVVTDTTSWQRISVIAQAPLGASHANPFVTTSGNAGGDAHIVTRAMFYEGTELVDYFDGATADDSSYTYEWTGPANASPSVRTPIVERLPELFTWKPGISAWDFLMPITSAAGVVLWCDEQRRWFLASPESRTIATLIAVTPSVTRDGIDTLSRDDPEADVTGVVLHYTWQDLDGSQEAWDTAGAPEKVLTIELKHPYPGPGAAAAILARRQGTGRRDDVTAIGRWDTTPGMTAQISLPGAPDTVGRITSIQFDLAAGFMTLGTSSLVDVIPGSIAWLTGTVDDLVGTVDSL